MCRTIKRLCGGLEAVWRTGGYMEGRRPSEGLYGVVDLRMSG